MKKFLSIILAVFMLMTVFPTVSLAANYDVITVGETQSFTTDSYDGSRNYKTMTFIPEEDGCYRFSFDFELDSWTSVEATLFDSSNAYITGFEFEVRESYNLHLTSYNLKSGEEYTIYIGFGGSGLASMDEENIPFSLTATCLKKGLTEYFATGHFDSYFNGFQIGSNIYNFEYDSDALSIQEGVTYRFTVSKDNTIISAEKFSIFDGNAVTLTTNGINDSFYFFPSDMLPGIYRFTVAGESLPSIDIQDADSGLFIYSDFPYNASDEFISYTAECYINPENFYCITLYTYNYLPETDITVSCERIASGNEYSISSGTVDYLYGNYMVVRTASGSDVEVFYDGLYYNSEEFTEIEEGSKGYFYICDNEVVQFTPAGGSSSGGGGSTGGGGGGSTGGGGGGGSSSGGGSISMKQEYIGLFDYEEANHDYIPSTKNDLGENKIYYDFPILINGEESHNLDSLIDYNGLILFKENEYGGITEIETLDVSIEAQDYTYTDEILVDEDGDVLYPEDYFFFETSPRSYDVKFFGTDYPWFEEGIKTTLTVYDAEYLDAPVIWMSNCGKDTAELYCRAQLYDNKIRASVGVIPGFDYNVEGTGFAALYHNNKLEQIKSFEIDRDHVSSAIFQYNGTVDEFNNDDYVIKVFGFSSDSKFNVLAETFEAEELSDGYGEDFFEATEPVTGTTEGFVYSYEYVEFRTMNIKVDGYEWSTFLRGTRDDEEYFVSEYAGQTVSGFWDVWLCYNADYITELYKADFADAFSEYHTIEFPDSYTEFSIAFELDNDPNTYLCSDSINIYDLRNAEIAVKYIQYPDNYRVVTSIEIIE